ncbi:hypothetical protein DMC30DRAFT_232937 [Rhodotorula diobovata]|uniref:Uncharacterized protein n=1 Tax=Rhodotorula diobovata TaxID=5288 RepID=A0A5C5FX78_9BASI|nr:hypothetical protein DMC30DRAFT_232937 [Rhodotorula diobovata]
MNCEQDEGETRPQQRPSSEGREWRSGLSGTSHSDRSGARERQGQRLDPKLQAQFDQQPHPSFHLDRDQRDLRSTTCPARDRDQNEGESRRKGGEGTGSERCASTALRRTTSGSLAAQRRARGQQRPDNPTSGTRGRYERAQGHRGARRGQDKSPSPDSRVHGSRLDGDATCRSSRPANSVALLREQDNSENNLVVGKTGQLD